MAHLIDKDVLVAEIDRQRDEALKRQQNLESIGQETVLNEMLANKLNSILSFLNTLEVKEVDLEKEIQAFALLELEPLKIYDANVGISITMHQLYQCAKHFFELGVKAKG